MIWCIEFDSSNRDIMIYALTSTGFSAAGFEDGISFWNALQTAKPDLVVLDVMLPGMDGVALLKRMKTSEEFRNIPVIMATAKGMEYDKIQSLDIGTDDYLVKPFGIMEMISRIKAVMRRYQTDEPKQQLNRDQLIMDLEQRTVCVEGQRVVLTYIIPASNVFVWRFCGSPLFVFWCIRRLCLWAYILLTDGEISSIFTAEFS